MINLKNILLLIILFLATGTAISGTIDPKNKDSLYIDYGKQFECVVQIIGQYDSVSFSASSIVIDKRYVITAAHVVKKASNCFIVHKNKKIRVKNILCHKDFMDEKFGVGDIAICECDDDIVLDIYPTLYINRDEIGKTCSMAGFGIAGKFSDNIRISDGERRAGKNLIEYIDNELLVCTASYQSDATKTNLEFIISHGDSGGGLFIDNKLAGVNSSVMAADKKPDSSYGDESCHTRISTYAPWIREHINYEK